MFVINVPNFNMFAIEKTNQGSRWRRGYGSVYIIIDGHDVLKVKQNGDNLLMDCSEQEFFDKSCFCETPGSSPLGSVPMRIRFC